MEKINDKLTALALCCDPGDKTVALFAAITEEIRLLYIELAEIKLEQKDLAAKYESIRAKSFTGIIDDVMAKYPASPTPPTAIEQLAAKARAAGTQDPAKIVAQRNTVPGVKPTGDTE